MIHSQEKLDFNQMLDKCWISALEMTKTAKLYQGTSPHDLSFIECVFRADTPDYVSMMVTCNSQGEVNIKTVDSPYLDDLVIHPPLEMTQAESEQFLLAAGYDGRWSCVVLRAPLYSVHYPPLYIYTIDNQYIAVDSTDGNNVFPLM